VSNNWIETSSGGKFSFTTPQNHALKIEDIAHALGNVCRFGGHTCFQRHITVSGTQQDARLRARIACFAKFLGRKLRSVFVRNHYSVAEHCVHVAGLLPPELKLIGLMHDGSEAYMGDIPRPLKEMLRDYKRIETRVQNVVWDQLVGRRPTARELRLVEDADDAMLYQERLKLLPYRADWGLGQGHAPADVAVRCWSQRTATRKFLDVWNDVKPVTTGKGK
jgi:hypothetical protein